MSVLQETIRWWARQARLRKSPGVHRLIIAFLKDLTAVQRSQKNG